MKHKTTFTSRVKKLGMQLELPPEQIQDMLTTTQNNTEQLSFSLGPPQYPGGYYGSISINNFNIQKKQ